MPRIPSAADVAPIGAGASRLATVRADAGDFGLAIAQGLGNLGDGLAALRPLAEDILRKEEQREEAEEEVDVRAHAVDLREAARQKLANWQYDGSSPREAARKASKEFVALSESRLKGLPPARQAVARQAVAGIAAAHSLQIAQRAQNGSVEALNRKTDLSLQLLQKQAVREPKAAARYADEGSALLHTQREAGALTPEQFVARDQAFRRGLFAAVIQGLPAGNAVAELEAGVHDAVIGDPALKDFLLTQARWRLQSEQAQGRAAADALVEDARRGTEPSALSTRTARLLAAGEMADVELAAERARRVRELLEPLRYAPDGVVREAVAELTPAEDATDAEERLRLQEETRIQAEAMLWERRHDPAAYVMSQPAVTEAFTAAERDPTLLDDAVAARLSAQAAMGLPAEGRRALTRAESTEILAGIHALPATERVAALATFAQRYGDQGGAVAAVLAEAGLSPVEVLLLDPNSDPAGWRALTQLVDRQRDGEHATTLQDGPIGEAAERLIAEGQQKTAAARDNGGQPPEDMRLSRESFRPKRNPLREDESLEGRLHIPKLTGTPREQAAAVMERLELGLSPPTDEVAEDVLDLLEQLVQYRQAVRAEGLAARKRFKERLGQVASNEFGRHLDYAFAPKVWEMANETIDSAYLHPWSLSNIELTSAIGAMAAKLREAADQSVGLQIISTIADLFLPAWKIARGIEYTLSAIGLGDAITTSVAQDHIGRLLNEAFHRKILVFDPRAVKGAGL